MDHFELHSKFEPTGDQPQAIEKLVAGFKEGNQCQTLLGVTGQVMYNHIFSLIRVNNYKITTL